jgi:hypothetical protein
MAVWECFHPAMHALSDEQQIDRVEGRIDRLETKIDRLETKMESGFTEVRSEARADFRTLIGIQLTSIVAMVLGFAGIILQHLS